MAHPIHTVGDGFLELLRRIELNPTRSNLASQRYNAVKQRIESSMRGKTVAQIGSFQRKTKIRPLDDSKPLDIDMIVCFGDAYQYAAPGEQGTTPAGALESVRRALVSDSTYRVMAPTSDAPTVVLEYADGFCIELTPCYRELTGKYPRPNGHACYIVGTSTGSWVPADYDFDAAFISGVNQLNVIEKALVPSIKMVKAFLRGKDAPLKSFHVEILCARVIPPALVEWQQKNWGYHHLLARFLSDAHAHLSGPVAIPNSYSPPVDSSLSSPHLAAIGSALAELGRQAWDICRESSEVQALQRWRDFYGDPFPA